MIRFGLTGGIATGKSLVARLLFEDHGILVADADQMARSLVEPGRPALEAVIRRFGAVCLAADGTLDRAVLGTLVASSRESRRDLEGILHPLIFEEMRRFFREQEAEDRAVAGVEASLLVETGRHRDRDLFDLLVVVSANPGLQRLRLEAQRGMSPEIVARWLHAQLPLGEKEAQADLLILNDGTREALRERVHELARRLRDWPLPPRPDTGPIRESP